MSVSLVKSVVAELSSILLPYLFEPVILVSKIEALAVVSIVILSPRLTFVGSAKLPVTTGTFVTPFHVAVIVEVSPFQFERSTLLSVTPLTEY